MSATSLQRQDPRPTWSSIRLLPPLMWVPLIAVLLTTIGVAAFSEWSAHRVRDTGVRVADVLRRLDALSNLKALVVDVETAQRGYLLTRDPSQLEPYARSVRSLPATEKTLAAVSRGRPQIEEHLTQISSLVRSIIERNREIIELSGAGRTEQAIALFAKPENRKLMEEFRQQVDAVDKLSHDELQELRQLQSASAVWSRVSLIVITLVSLGLLLIVLRLIAAEAERQELRRSAAEQEAKHLEKLVEERTQELSALSTHLQEFSEKEKSEIARNLHDELGGLLTAAKMDLSWLQSRIADSSIQQRLQQLGGVLDEAMDLKRRVVEDLRPSLLDHFGLPTALRAYVESVCRKAGLAYEVEVSDDESVPRDTAIALFRVVQEGLTNAIRHAHATKIRLEFASAAEGYRLQLSDDGKGMDLSSRQLKWSHGISGMRHRIRALGGRFHIDSAPGKGTQLRVEVPVANVSDSKAQQTISTAHRPR